LSSIYFIEATPNLNYLDVSSNVIQDLSPLSETPYLAWIGADHNYITTLEDFLPENNVCKPVRSSANTAEFLP